MQARAEEFVATGYYAAGSLEADDVESRNAAAEFGLPLGIAGWLHLGAGTSTTTVAISADRHDSGCNQRRL